jgi:hypothetical protein
MKKKNSIALFFYAFGIIYLLDWIIFVEKNDDLYDDFPTMKAKYIARFPDILKPLLETNPQPAAILFTILFSLCGMQFIRNKGIPFKILGATSFLLAFWNLFSIM